MATSLLTTLLAEPAVADPPRRVWRDWLLVAVLAPTALIEGALRSDITWSPVTNIIVAALSFVLLWRRTAPLVANIVGFGTLIVLDQIATASGEPAVEIYTMAFVLLFPYALFRWGSGRHAAIGLVILLAISISSWTATPTTFGDAIGGVIVLLVPVALGIEVRQLLATREQRLNDVKHQERSVLARELHDTVAHHVSAIAIRAQAGQVVGATDPAAALDALAVIESEASKTLAEMRGIVGALRDTDTAQFTPQPGVVEIAGFASSSDGLDISVTVHERASDVGPTVGAALYRVAQEAITNARRHARDVTEVTVSVDADDDRVRLVVTDDGRGAPARAVAGFGMVGMTERAELLGGELHAGPNPGGGWTVDATIPRHGASA